jgi:hypothetical protein
MSPDGNTIYIADDRTTGGGVQKWVWSGVNYVLSYTLSSGLNFLTVDLNPLLSASESGVRGLYVDWTAANPMMWATTPLGLCSLTDTGSGSKFTQLVNLNKGAATSSFFRGLDGSAVPEPWSATTTVVALGALLARFRRRR